MALTRLYSILFAAGVSMLTIFDKRRQNTLLTPFSVSAWPLVFIVLVVNFLLVYMNFQTVTPHVIVFLSANLILIWLIGLVFSYLYENDRPSSFNDVFLPYVKFENLLILLSWIVNIVVFLRVKNLLAIYGGFSFFGDFRFEEMITRGPVAHLSQFGKVTFLLLCFIYPMAKHKISIIITLFGLILTFFALQVKYNLIGILLIVFIYYNYLNAPKKQFSNVIKFCLVVVILMALFLVFLTISWGTFAVSKKSVRLFLSQNLLSYFFSPPIVLDKWLNYPFVQPDWTLLLVFKNIINQIVGNPLVYSSLNYTGLGFSEVAKDVYSNVATSYGTYFIIGGWVFSLFMSAVISFVTYFVYYITNKKPTPIKIFLCMTLLNLALTSFFGQYFTFVSYYEMILFFIITIKLMDVYNEFICLPQKSEKHLKVISDSHA